MNCRLENNSKAVGDVKPKISYSDTKLGAIGLFANFYYVYTQYKLAAETEGKEGRMPRKDKPSEIEQFEAIKKSKSFEDFLGKGMFLIFDGTNVTNTGGNKGNINIFDASTNDTIKPESLQVCMLRNIDTNEMSYSKYDFIQYLMANISDKDFSELPPKIQEFVTFYIDAYKDSIEKFRNGNYEIEYFSLEKFNKIFENDIKKDILEYSQKINAEYVNYFHDQKSEFAMEQINSGKESLGFSNSIIPKKAEIPIFSEKEIGKATVYTPVEQKQEAQRIGESDMRDVEQEKQSSEKGE